jgi:hypothetical protein
MKSRTELECVLIYRFRSEALSREKPLLLEMPTPNWILTI